MNDQDEFSFDHFRPYTHEEAVRQVGRARLAVRFGRDEEVWLVVGVVREYDGEEVVTRLVLANGKRISVDDLIPQRCHRVGDDGEMHVAGMLKADAPDLRTYTRIPKKLLNHAP